MSAPTDHRISDPAGRVLAEPQADGVLLAVHLDRLVHLLLQLVDRDQRLEFLERLRRRRGEPLRQIVGNAVRGHSEVEGFSIPGFSQSGDTENYNANFNVSWELDLIGRRRDAVRAIDAELAAVRFNAEAAKASLAANVAQSYFQIRALDVQLENARESARVQGSLADVDVVLFLVEAGRFGLDDAKVLALLQDRTGVPTIATLPMWWDHGLPEEDGVHALGHPDSGAATRTVAVIAYPRISNLDEFQPLKNIPGVRLQWVRSPAALAGLKASDWIILPGSKHTSSDLAWLRERGLGDDVLGSYADVSFAAPFDAAAAALGEIAFTRNAGEALAAVASGKHDAAVLMTGPAEFVFEGEIEL